MATLVSTDYVEEWLTGPKSHQFYTRTYHDVANSPKAVLVFVHGFCEHIGRHGHVFPFYQQRGVTVFAYDQRGFGRTALDEDNRSKDASYGKTSWDEQFEDIEFFVKRAGNEFPGLPIFLMGHSMGGGLVLGFATRSHAPPDPSTVSLLSGVIASSPSIQRNHPAPILKRLLGEKTAGLSANKIIPMIVKVEELSHDAAFNEAYKKDPMIKGQGTLRGVSDMLNGGYQLLARDYKHWPQNLPLLIVHGTEDKVTSHKASEEFFNRIETKKKKHILFPGGYHELQNEPDGVKEKFLDDCLAFIREYVQIKEQAKL